MRYGPALIGLVIMVILVMIMAGAGGKGTRVGQQLLFVLLGFAVVVVFLFGLLLKR